MFGEHADKNRVLCNAYADLRVKKISFSFVKMLEMQD